MKRCVILFFLACEPILTPAIIEKNGNKDGDAKCLSILCGYNQNTYVQQVPVPVQQYNPYGGFGGFGGLGGLGGFGGLGGLGGFGGLGGLFFDEVLEEAPGTEEPTTE